MDDYSLTGLPDECPHCRQKLDAATPANFGDPPKPREGDVSVCFYCGGLLQFGAHLMAIPMTEEVWNALDPGTRVLLATCSEIIRQRRKNEMAEQIPH